jgi:hypothetical protein
MSTSWTLTLHPLLVVMLVAGLVPPTAFLMVKSLESTSSHVGEHLAPQGVGLVLGTIISGT